MISIVRKGPKILAFETDNVEELKNYFLVKFSAEEHGYNDAFERSEEGDSLLFITDKLDENIKKLATTSNAILAVKSDTGPLLASIITDGKSGLIKSIKAGPKIIIMRVFGNVEKIIDTIQSEYEGTRENVTDLLLNFENIETVVIFTKKPLNKKMTFEDLFHQGLFIDEDYFTLYKKFGVDALKYVNEGLEKKDWYEMEIRIYDRYSAYDYHYQKLIKVLETLELGLVLGEAWAKDYPRMFMAVGVYRLRFFSFYEPGQIKKVLMGLEYSKEGVRIVDYDLYFKRKHVHWSELIENNIRTRNELGMRFREQIYEKLNERTADEIAELDEKIMKTRVE